MNAAQQGAQGYQTVEILKLGGERPGVERGSFLDEIGIQQLPLCNGGVDGAAPVGAALDQIGA